MTLRQTIQQIGKRARQASQQLALKTTAEKNSALLAIAAEILTHQAAIKTANSKDLRAAKKAKLSEALLDRLELNNNRIADLAEGAAFISILPDPIGQISSENKRPNGLIIRKVRMPIGVIAVIYESRPNVTVDVATLCLKTSNATILRGGTEAIHSNRAIMTAMKTALKKTSLPEHSIQLITTTERSAVKYLVQMTNFIDLAIPRGGEDLINAVTKMARVPVIKHYKGVCHTYVDKTADLTMALNICENAKCQRPGVCNSMETLLVHEAVANKFLPLLAKQFEKCGVELRGDKQARAIIPNMKIAKNQDWETEYLDLILAVKVVKDIDAAIYHINTFGSHHSDAIITETEQAKQKFLQEVDSAVVYVNASTRFTDGVEFGMGAEIGISTDKLHARGPMGLEELTTYKYEIIGTGQIRT